METLKSRFGANGEHLWLVQGLLFGQNHRKKQAALDTAADQIRERFGTSALRRAASLPTQREVRRKS
jgi:hypothetical protein